LTPSAILHLKEWPIAEVPFSKIQKVTICEWTSTNGSPLSVIQNHFHQLIRKRATEEFDLDITCLELPTITERDLKPLTEQPYFTVAGIYGGFAYTLKNDPTRGYVLLVESWCRICGFST
jgi:hypothetical protein